MSFSVMQCPQGVRSAQRVEGTPAPGGWGGAGSVPGVPATGPLVEPAVGPEDVRALLCVTMKQRARRPRFRLSSEENVPVCLLPLHVPET